MDELTALVKAVYGDSVDARDLIKNIDAADVHIDGALRVKRKRKPVRKADDGALERHKKLLAAGLLAGTAIEAAAAKETIRPLARAVGTIKPDLRGATTLAGKAKALKPLAIKPNDEPLVPGHPLLPRAAGAGTKAALQGGNALVGMAAAKELIHPRKKVEKGVRLSLRPINAALVKRPPSLKAVKPAGSPPISKKGVYHNLRSASAKANRLIPTPRTAAALGAGALVAGGLAAGTGTYVGAKHGTRAALRQQDVEKTFRGEISKVDTEKRQVFGWAYISARGDTVIRDRQGDEWPIEELEKTAYDFVHDSRVGGDQHARIVKFDGAPRHTSDVIESVVFTPEKIEKMGLPSDFPQGWWIGMQVNDEQTWQLIKSGKRTGFSVHGTGRRTPIEKADTKLRERARQAIHPPEVSRKPVKSTALRSLGYQRQTRRLSVQMHSREAPYIYKVPPAVAAAVVNADSKGKAYTSLIRGQRKRDPKVGPISRVRLFAHPDQVQKAGDQQRKNPKAHAVELGAQTVAGGIGSAFGAAKLRDAYKSEHPQHFRATTMRGAQKLVRAGVSPPRAEHALKLVRTGKPNFKALVTLAGAGSVAAGAHRYQQIQQFAENRKRQAQGWAGGKAFVAPTPITQIARVPKVKPRHAPTKYVGQHRKLTPLDQAKLTAKVHSRYLPDIADAIAGSLQ